LDETLESASTEGATFFLRRESLRSRNRANSDYSGVICPVLFCPYLSLKEGAALDKLITNNPLAAKDFADRCAVEYADVSLRDILVRVRDYVHKGHKLLTHPLSGSIKPGETPYKSILVSAAPGQGLDLPSLRIIEDSIVTCDKFPIKYPHIPEHVLADFQEVDRTLIAGALCKHSSSK
jgi:hypothetical protein